MAHFAQINNGLVIRVVVVSNADITENGVEVESKGVTFLKNLLGQDTEWVQASYNKKKRKNFPCPGYTYDAEKDAFIAPKPFPSWVYDEAKGRWKAPAKAPNGAIRSKWNEGLLTWEER